MASSRPVIARKPAARKLKSRLRLVRDKPLRQGMLGAFSSVLAVPRRCAAAASQRPVEAVHEYRKAIRRSRALLRLLRPAIGKRAYRGFLSKLKEAFRETSSLRDSDVLLEALRSLPPGDGGPARAAVERALQEETAGGKDASRAEAALARGVAALKPLPAALAVVLPEDYSLRELERGLSKSAGLVADTLARARGSGANEDFHQWRKAVKEMRYQVELLASTGSRDLRAREKELGELAQRLGRVTDLFVLRDEIVARQSAGRIPEAPELLAAISQRAAEQVGELLDRGAALFSGKPAAYARRLLAERG